MPVTVYFSLEKRDGMIGIDEGGGVRPDWLFPLKHHIQTSEENSIPFQIKSLKILVLSVLLE